jgi:hypothetical protein
MKNDDIEITDHKTESGEHVKVVKINSPYAVSAVRGIVTPIVLAIIVAGIAAPFVVPAQAMLIAIANGIAALGWFILYKVSSTAAAYYFNQLNLQRAVYAAEADMMKTYIDEIVGEKQGNLSEENLSNPIDSELGSDPAEPSELKSGE